MEGALQALDVMWDSATDKATTLHSLAHSSFDADMASLEIRDIAPELLKELKRKHIGKKQLFNTEAMEWVARICRSSQVIGQTSLRLDRTHQLYQSTHTNTSQQSLRLVTSAEVKSNLS
jgi:hypothetical protein